ncbi:hypothetical protein ACTFIY_007101 [Dictyostelium cf. discoideum]
MGTHNSKPNNTESSPISIEDQKFNEQIINENVVENPNPPSPQLRYNPDIIPKIPSLPSRPFDLPVGDSPEISEQQKLPTPIINGLGKEPISISKEDNERNKGKQNDENLDEINSPLSVHEVNEDLLRTMKVDDLNDDENINCNDTVPLPSHPFVDVVECENVEEEQEEQQKEIDDNIEKGSSSLQLPPPPPLPQQQDEEQQLKQELLLPPPPPPPPQEDKDEEQHHHQRHIKRERFQTKAEAELLNLFNKTPIIDTTDSPTSSSVGVNQQQQNYEEMIAAADYFNTTGYYSYKDVPKNQKSQTLSKRFFNTLTRKKSMKNSSINGFNTISKSQTTGSLNSKLSGADITDEDERNVASSSSTVFPTNTTSSSNDDINLNRNGKPFTKYSTVSMKMSTFRKKLFTSQQDLHSPNVTEASDIEEKKEEEKPKKKKFFNSQEISNLGSMFTREMGHVFLLSPSGPSYHSSAYAGSSYMTSGF